ncbi:MAG: hypothetical protein C6W57_03570 [Caldibacillus debilis]|nr:MAG: hypothetical protein C6W57_03570 [Caldibacillus debilis]
MIPLLGGLGQDLIRFFPKTADGWNGKRNGFCPFPGNVDSACDSGTLFSRSGGRFSEKHDIAERGCFYSDDSLIGGSSFFIWRDIPGSGPIVEGKSFRY